MKVKTVVVSCVAGMFLSAAGAMAIPTPGPKLPTPSDAVVAASKAVEPAHFTSGDTLALDARLGHAALGHGGTGETFVLATVTGAESSAASAPPLNLALVIDRSGSMKGERIARAIDAAVGIVERMREDDSVTVVSFDDHAEIVVPPSRPRVSARPSIEAAIRAIRLGGDTCISCGLEEAMSQISVTSLAREHVDRMILLSDGEANRGIRDVTGLRALAAHMRDRGCSISTIGVDVDFDEKVMAAIASESNGRHYFVENASSLPAIFEKEFDSLLATVARDGELEVELAPGVEVEKVFDRPFQREGASVKVPFGTFAAKQEKTVLMKLRVPIDRDGVVPVVQLKLGYRDLVRDTDGGCAGNLALLVTDDSAASESLDPFVAARLSRSETAETLTSANALFAEGRAGEARSVVERHKSEVTRSFATAHAAARALPTTAPAKVAGLDFDFRRQMSALDLAGAGFAPPPASAAGAAPAEATHAGKASVRTNQEAATTMGF